MAPRPPTSTLFPYTTLFRSRDQRYTCDKSQSYSIKFLHKPNWVIRETAKVCLYFIERTGQDRKSTRLNSSHRCISYAVFCLKKKNKIFVTPATSPGRPTYAV